MSEKLNNGALRILVCEDDTTNQQVLRYMLEFYGAAVTIKGDGQSLLHCVGQAAWDLIFLDFHLPDLTCRYIFEQLQKGLGGIIPVVGMTGDTDARQHQELLSLGMHEILIKPISLDDLAKIVAMAADVKAKKILHTLRGQRADLSMRKRNVSDSVE